MARPEHRRLHEFVRLRRESLDNVVIGTEIMEGAIRVSKDLEGQRSIPDILLVGFNPNPWFRCLDLHLVCHGAVRATFGAWGDGITSSQEADEGSAAGENR